jgi:hypothetical protein
MLPVAPLTDHATVTPDGRLRTENCVVPAGATVAVVGLTLVAGEAGGLTDDFARLIVEVDFLVGSATLVAVIVTALAAGILSGAVYKPFTNVPTLGLNDQVTSVLEVPLTIAAYCLDWPALIDRFFGFSEMLTTVACGVVAAGAAAGPSRIVAVAVWLGSAKLVAEIVTKELDVTLLGAV